MTTQRERELVTLRLQYSALFQMHMRLNMNGAGITNEERAEHADLCHAYEIGLSELWNMIELYLEKE